MSASLASFCRPKRSWRSRERYSDRTITVWSRQSTSWPPKLLVWRSRRRCCCGRIR